MQITNHIALQDYENLKKAAMLQLSFRKKTILKLFRRKDILSFFHKAQSETKNVSDYEIKPEVDKTNEKNHLQIWNES